MFVLGAGTGIRLGEQPITTETPVQANETALTTAKLFLRAFGIFDRAQVDRMPLTYSRP